MRLQRPGIHTIRLLLAVCFTFLIIGGGAVWAEESAALPEMSLSADRQSYPLNDTIKLTVLAREVNDLYAVKSDLTYDDQFVTLIDGTIRNAAWPEGYLRSQTAPGSIRFVSSKLGAASGDTGSFSLVTLQFKPLKQGETVIRLVGLSGSDSALQLLSFAEPSELTIRITAPDYTPPTEVSRAKSKETLDKVTLSWEDPKDDDLTEVRIYLDGEMKAAVGKGTEQADITGLIPKTDYRFVIKTVDHAGNESAGLTVKAKTKNAAEDTENEDDGLDEKHE